LLSNVAAIGFLISAVASLGGSSATAQPASRSVSCAPPAVGQARPWLDKTLSPQCRAKAVVDSFHSLDEKVAAIMGGGPGGGGRNAAWLQERDLEQGGGGDGPSGIRGQYGVTAFPAPLTAAAAFDPKVAAQYGNIIGEEVFAFGNNSLTGPAMDMTRTWHFGRSVESFGEDPVLAAGTVGPEIAALQSHHVMATMKHFAVYTQEQGRAGDAPLRLEPAVDEVVSERAIREIYLPAFESAVRAGGANVMCAFPRVNGVYACENAHLLGVLKNEWGFEGSVGPDFPDAQRSIIAAVNAGLDSGVMAGTPAAPPTAGGGGALAIATDNSFNGESLKTAVAEGKVSPERIDNLLMRRLVPAFRLGVFDNPARKPGHDVSTPARRAAAADIVTAGAVLLKNRGGILPFGPSVKSIALIGDQAGAAPVVTEMGSANVHSTHLSPVLPAVRARAGKVKVSYSRGTLGLDRLPMLPTSLVKSPDGQAGFQAEYVAGPNFDFSQKPIVSRVEPAINNTELSAAPGLPANRAWSARWSGVFTAPESGVQKFTVAGSGTARFYIDDKLIGYFANDDFADTIYANVPMTAGKSIRIRVEWTPRTTLRQVATDDMSTTLGPAVRLGWSAPDDLIAQAAAAARKADVAVVFVGQKVGEGMDRTYLHLSNDQDALIEAVAKANPRTVVVLNTGGAVTMPWLDKVAGVMEMWLPGDAQGPAAAKLLFGDAEPGGRLPVTFPRDETQGPGTTPSQYPGDLSAKKAVDTAHFDEGALIGYRYWDQHGQTPLFPFGYGLSYGRFNTKVLNVGRTADGGAEVQLSVTNVGKRAASDVVQVYLGFPAEAGEAPKQLKGYGRVVVRPQQSLPLNIPLPPSAFKYWDEKKSAWSVAGGDYTIYVARSSRDVLYKATIHGS
jgi:beta-glucosidase